MMNVFVYGSLMFDIVWNTLIINRYQKIDARLDDFKRMEVKGEVYPGLIAAEGGVVDGLLMLAMRQADILVLDSFEGEYYARSEVVVSASDGRLIRAQTYVFRDKYRYLLANAEWDIEEFSSKGINTFLMEYEGFFHNQRQ
jgi:gamma-glutamylcyclotransferase (GGCT)/AIG2-like uncharacterized protein YtfP